MNYTIDISKLDGRHLRPIESSHAVNGSRVFLIGKNERYSSLQYEMQSSRDRQNVQLIFVNSKKNL